MSTFKDFWSLGFRRLVPIIPPDAEISANSSLNKRLDARGKAVGIRGRDGKWFGFDWLPHEADEHDLTRWAGMGAGIGIKTGQGLIGIDCDTLDVDRARIIAKALAKHFPALPMRVGRAPKFLVPLRISEPLRYMRVEFGELDDKGRLKDRVEILSDGRQFVAAGTHPGTGKPYTWPRPLVPLEQLPIVPAGSVVAFLEELRQLLPAAKPLVTEGSTINVDQASLRGDVSLVRKAVNLIPNTSEHFATRESYRDFGYAIKAALGDTGEAFDIFAEWCGRWRDGTNDPAIVEADWRRMKPPYRRGANWLFELAEHHAPKDFTRAEAFFEPIADEPENPFAQDLSKPFEERPTIEWIDPAAWVGVEPKPRRWLVDGVIPDGEVSLLTGEGGVGKTLSAQQLGTCVARGIPFLGRNTAQSKVMMFLCEDSGDELHHRQRDINAALCLDMADVSPNLRIASRKYMDNLLASFDRNSMGVMKRTAVWDQLCTDAKAFGAKLVVVDTIADTFGGSEIDRAQVRQFVQSCLGRLAQEIGGAVLALGHPSKAGQAVGGDGTSGSTAWHATVRSRLYLEYATKDKSGPFRKLSTKKANYGPMGDQWTLRWAKGAFELVTAKSSATHEGDAASLGGVLSTAEAIDAAILDGVHTLALAGSALSNARNSPYWAPRVLRARCDATLGMYGEDDVAAGWQRALDRCQVRVAVVARKQGRQGVMGYELTEPADQQSRLQRMSDGVFE